MTENERTLELRIESLKSDLEAAEKRSDMCADLCRGVAATVGVPAEGEGSSWHDLPEKVKAKIAPAAPDGLREVLIEMVTRWEGLANDAELFDERGATWDVCVQELRAALGFPPRGDRAMKAHQVASTRPFRIRMTEMVNRHMGECSCPACKAWAAAVQAVVDAHDSDGSPRKEGEG